MRSVKSLVVAAVVAISSLVPFGAVDAMPLSAPALSIDKQTDVTDVAWRRVCNYRGCRRVWVSPRVVVRPRVVIRPPVVVVPRTVVRRGWNAHVRWCLNRYQSYSPASDTYLGYDGYYHRCISPYR
jgi:hypothetical protein